MKNPVGTLAESFNRSAEDQPEGIQGKKNSVGSEADSFNRSAEDQPQGVQSKVHLTYSYKKIKEGCSSDDASDGASGSASQSLLERAWKKQRGFW